MTKAIGKAVPRSRLNITYRTRIDGQVVPKELPLRLLIAANFSGRKGGGDKGDRPLPPLATRLMHSIGKEGTLEGVFSRTGVSLPIPASMTEPRRLSLIGRATIRVEKTKNVDDSDDYRVTIKSSAITQGVELKRAAGSKAVVAADTRLYTGEVVVHDKFSLVTLKAVAAAAASSLRLARDAAAKAATDAQTAATAKTTADQALAAAKTAAAAVPAGDPNKPTLDQAETDAQVAADQASADKKDADDAKVAADQAVLDAQTASDEATADAKAVGGKSMPQAPLTAAGEVIDQWRAALSKAPALSSDEMWLSAGDVHVSGSVSAVSSVAAEPESLFETTGKARVYLKLDDGLTLEEAFLDGGVGARELRADLFVETVEASRRIPLTDMQSFVPERVAAAVPELRRLLVVRWLLSQGRSMIASNPLLRVEIKKLLAAAQERKQTIAEVQSLDPTGFGENKEYVKKLLDKAQAPSTPPTEANAQRARALVDDAATASDKTKQEELEKLTELLQSDDWLAKLTAEKKVGNKTSDEEKKWVARFDKLNAPPAWAEILNAVEDLDLRLFKNQLSSMNGSSQ